MYMAIRRTRLAFEDKFTQVPNEWVRDVRISRRARGFLAELMSHQPGWIITVESLAEKGPEGTAAVRSALQELKDAGYLVVEKLKNDKGHYTGTDYELRDPFAGGQLDTITPHSDNPHAGSSTLGESHTKKTSLKEDYSEELLSTEVDVCARKAGDADLKAEFENEWYPHYPRKESRGDALKAFKQMRRGGASLEDLVCGVKTYQFPTERRYVKLPATWLRAQCWMDEQHVSKPATNQITGDAPRGVRYYNPTFNEETGQWT